MHLNFLLMLKISQYSLKKISLFVCLRKRIRKLEVLIPTKAIPFKRCHLRNKLLLLCQQS